MSAARACCTHWFFPSNNARPNILVLELNPRRGYQPTPSTIFSSFHGNRLRLHDHERIDVHDNNNAGRRMRQGRGILWLSRPSRANLLSQLATTWALRTRRRRTRGPHAEPQERKHVALPTGTRPSRGSANALAVFRRVVRMALSERTPASTRR